MPYVRYVRTTGLTALAALILSACGSAGGGYAPPPPPPPPDGSGPVLRDWRSIITSYDRDRYGRVDAAWRLALEQARRQEGSGDLGTLGALIDPDAAVGGVTPPEGDYRCRTVKLGSQGGEGGLGYVVYGWFDCRIERTPAGLKFSKLSGPPASYFRRTTVRWSCWGPWPSGLSRRQIPTARIPTATWWRCWSGSAHVAGGWSFPGRSMSPIWT